MSNIFLVCTSVLALSFIVAYINSVSKIIEMKKLMDDLEDALISITKHAKNDIVSEEDLDIHKENFIKFLSESRDSAFEYIENVQNGLKAFEQDAGPSIKYFDDYGDVMNLPISDNMKKISAAYKELQLLLPNEEEEK